MPVQTTHNKVRGNVRLTAEQKREQSRRQILDVSLELFYTNGYQNTTTRDIVKKTGILNGSLYNRFKSKEDILLCIVSEYIESILKESEKLIEKENNMIVAAILPSAFEIWVSSVDKKAADLFYEAHKIWAAVDIYTDINTKWFSKYLGRFEIDIASIENVELKLMTFLGGIGNICGYYAKGGQEPCEEILRHILNYMSVMVNVPIIDHDQLIKKIMAIVKETACDMYREIPHLNEI